MDNKTFYPDTDDENFQSKIFSKREFHYHKVPYREKLTNYEDIKNYRESICKGEFKLREQQILLTNFISEETPYNGLLIMHGTGTGKTCTAISIAEQFKEQVKKYNTKIYILTFGPNNRETFKEQLLFCTGDTYVKNKDLFNQMTKAEIDLEKKLAIYGALQYYKILSYKTFYKKVLGEKIAEKKLVGDKKIKTSYRKTEEGEFEREIVVDKISNMDNSLLIVDEAHNLTGNEYGEALKKIIKNSKNLRVILLTATPMKNLGDDIIDIINFIRPPDDQIKRDKVFTNDKNYLMQFKENGQEYLRKMATGYVSFFRGNIPFTFATRVDKGEILDELLYTPVVKCFMEDFQLEAYKKSKINKDDTLDRASSSAANFVYPGLSSDGKNLVGYFSTDGLNKSISQINQYKSSIIEKINKNIFKNKIDKNDIEYLLKETADKNLGGKILNLKYLRHFSIKFYKCIKRLGKLVNGNKGTGTAFIYSNLVKAGGMEIFSEALKENGYLEYDEDKNNYSIQDNTIDYRTGFTFGYFKKNKLNLSDFKPATFMLITGGGEDTGEDISEIKQKIIREVFNVEENKDGQNLKFILGSKVMTEGVTLENVREVHILDVHYNLGKIDQVIGRAIRMCKHQAVITDKNRFPKVNVYRYVVSLKGELSSDEKLYQKAEKKYILVKKVERVIKEAAIDCPLLLNGNKFPEEIEKYKNCAEPTLENKRKNKKLCPAICDFQECDFKCTDKKLDKYYNKNTYENLSKKEVDYNTFTEKLAKSEIVMVKTKIKDLFRFKHVYTYDELYNNILNSYTSEEKDLFDKYFLDKALFDMIPKTENDYNNFTDNIFDKFNKTGYLIQRGKYYIFQPFDDIETVSLASRKKFIFNLDNMIPISNYFIQKFGDNIKEKEQKEEKKVKIKYDFETNKKYYLERNENFIVGIIDLNKGTSTFENKDIFKIRPPIEKGGKLKRGTGIYSLKGAVCATSKDKDYLADILIKSSKLTDKVKFNLGQLTTRDSICNKIMLILLYMEKYSTKKNNNKKTYIIIPSNHENYQFPYNLEDRIKYKLDQVKNILKREFDHSVKKSNNGKFMDISGLPSYLLEIKVNKYITENRSALEKMGFSIDNSKISHIIA